MARKPESEQTIEIPLKVGARVEILENVDMDECGSFVAETSYSATVEEYCPSTGLLRMSDGTGYAEMKQKLKEADSIQVIRE